ncbi:MAG TPA: trypsin-like peptidase domain-containing protein [Blastocatellia bacterium]|nr:trypsin-like peptidase domain-containing protein [Blastocatellia bacterium]
MAGAQSRLKIKTPAAAVVVALFAAYASAAYQETSPRQTQGGKPPQSKKQAGLTPEIRAHVRQAVSAVGLIFVRASGDPNQPPRPRGSAVIVRKDGIVATNWHVIFDSRSGRIFGDLLFTLSPDGNASSTSLHYRLKPVLLNKEYDLALLRIEPEAGSRAAQASTVFQAVAIGDSKAVRLLDDLFIIGFPEKGGLTVTVNRGTVEGRDILGNWIKTDGRMIHGNSGGAAVNARGELIGIPTKVVADSQPIDRDGDGFPEDVRVFGAVGFLRPSHLISAMLAELDSQVTRQLQVEPATPTPTMAAAPTVNIRGIVKSAADGKPVAGALVGLLSSGARQITESTLLTWGTANADGEFILNKPVPPGSYTLKTKALGYDASEREIKIDENGLKLVIELKPSQPK